MQTLILRGVFLCRRADVDYFFQGNAADFALDPLGIRVPISVFPAAWEHFVTEIPREDRGDVVKGLAKIFAEQPQNEAERERVLKAASACVAWESSASRLKRDESSQSQPNQKYASMAGRILIHYMIYGGFLCAGGETNRDNNYILDHVDRLKRDPGAYRARALRQSVSSTPGGSPRAGFARRWQQRGELLYYHGRP